MGREYNESHHIGIPLEDSDVSGKEEYNFLLITEVYSYIDEPTGRTEGLSQSVRDKVFEGFNVYLFDQENREVDFLDYEQPKNLLSELDADILGIDFERIKEGLDSIPEEKEDFETISFEEFEPPLNRYKMSRALREYDIEKMLGNQ